MRVQSITIKDVLGISDLQIEPGSLTVISGQNGVGKSSALAAIRSVMSGGHEPDLIRQGAAEGSVIVTLEDGITIAKIIRPEKSTLTVRHPELGKISKSQQWINGIVDSLSLDPIAFLSAPAHDRVRILLEAIPLTVSAEQLAFLGADTPSDLSGHALEVIARIHRSLYDERTGINRAAKEKRATVAQMTATLPAEPAVGDWAAIYKQRLSEDRALQQAMQERVSDAKGDAERSRNISRENCHVEKTSLATDQQREIDQIRRKYAELVKQAEDRRDARIREADTILSGALAFIEAECGARKAELQTSLAEAKAQSDLALKSQAAREFIRRLDAETSELEGGSRALSSQIEQLEALKGNLLKSLPIHGLEISDGQVTVDGIPFDRVNDATKYRMAIEVARLRSGELGLVLLDRAEIFDEHNWSAFKEAALAAGVQLIVARVAEGPLTVEAAMEES